MSKAEHEALNECSDVLADLEQELSGGHELSPDRLMHYFRRLRGSLTELRIALKAAQGCEGPELPRLVYRCALVATPHTCRRSEGSGITANPDVADALRHTETMLTADAVGMSAVVLATEASLARGAFARAKAAAMAWSNVPVCDGDGEDPLCELPHHHVVAHKDGGYVCTRCDRRGPPLEPWPTHCERGK